MSDWPIYLLDNRVAIPSVVRIVGGGSMDAEPIRLLSVSDSSFEQDLEAIFSAENIIVVNRDGYQKPVVSVRDVFKCRTWPELYRRGRYWNVYRGAGEEYTLQRWKSAPGGRGFEIDEIETGKISNPMDLNKLVEVLVGDLKCT